MRDDRLRLAPPAGTEAKVMVCVGKSVSDRIVWF